MRTNEDEEKEGEAKKKKTQSFTQHLPAACEGYNIQNPYEVKG
jgi:hypothetical protein